MVCHSGKKAAWLERLRSSASDGEAARDVYVLEGRRAHIAGRAAGTDLTVWDERASRIHCRFDLRDGGYELRDLHSTNGVRVNGRRVESHRLRNGDRIQIGRTRFRFHG